MIVVYPFSLRDQALALKNAQWIRDLGGCKGHEVLVCYDKRCTIGKSADQVEAVGKTMLESFDKVYRLVAEAAIDGWPEGANYLFRLCTTWLQSKPRYPYFFWMEPDAIPLTSGWLDTLEAEYKRAAMPFMGDRVEVDDIPVHMSGIGFYPNPIYILAGEAYRAHDVAWDMAAKDQIIHQAHFTELIEHAWQHPPFQELFELDTQLAEPTILFHASKDGSLIDMLRLDLSGGKQSSLPPSSTAALPIQKKEPEEPGSPSRPTPAVYYLGVKPEVVYDIFIRTYPGDYQWLEYCLQSIRNFCSGFRKIWIVSPAEFKTEYYRELFQNVIWLVRNDETEDGYLAQQITKLYADVLCDYQADYILHVDSDVIFTRPTTPGEFFKDGKLIWYYTPYEDIVTPWQPIIEKFMGFTQPYEFMRRLPMMLPRWLYPRMREFCHKIHGVIVSEYVRMQPPRAFSEFNALGAYAYFHHRDRFEWIDTSREITLPLPFARQFHSWSGLTLEVKSDIDNILRGGQEASHLAHNQETEGSIPSPATNLGVSDKQPGKPGSADTKDGLNRAIVQPDNAPPAPIKVLPSGVWVLEGDQISGWIEQEGRLDHDQNLLPVILRHIKPNDTVVDAGAFIGDHTVAYLKAVGKHGLVAAFEPSPLAFQCLKHNLGDNPALLLYEIGLGDKKDTVPLSGNNGNYGGSYVGAHMKIDDIEIMPLDHYAFPVNFIKIDVEGYEYKVLRGAAKTIAQHKPIMVIEINQVALERQLNEPKQIFGWLYSKGYRFSIIEENAKMGDPLYNILAEPKK